MKKSGGCIVSWCRMLECSIYVGHAVGEAVGYVEIFQCIEDVVGHGNIYLVFLVVSVNS